jgi:methionyl-tRNA formyltransferase
MTDVRIVFMGTPDFAVCSLDRLVRGGYPVVGVVTVPDKPAGRGRKLQQSAVKLYALENELKVLQPANLKNEDFLSDLKALNANLQVVVAFRMLPRIVWSMPSLGTFNLHASLLPEYRGAAPINWVIITGETKTGVTTFFIDDKIDTGAILFQESTVIGPHETAGELHDRLMEMGARLVLETVKHIVAGTANAQPQPERPLEKLAPKIHPETCVIAWDNPLQDVYNHIRGLSPYQAARAVLHNGAEIMDLKIYKALPERAKHQLKPGTILWGKDYMNVAEQQGYIMYLELQLAVKRRLGVKELLNGLLLEKNTKNY